MTYETTRNPEWKPEEPARHSWALASLPWPEVGRALARDPRLIIPVGALVQHGPHLPVGTNTFRKYARGLVATPPPGSRGTLGFPSLATAKKGTMVFYRYINTVKEVLDGSLTGD